ncbi:MAG: aminoacyl-tRNA hydrolase [Acidimicrobiia bacterium]|nr:aminoacyl-tRNA hydrolase [Acidimicrobiia bacterium]NNL28352.1 aminoacyl-tRNA hydrolase [Acidimicrobiia bacterium]
MDGIDIPGHFIIPEDELEWEFSTSGGPGGQHANRSATRVELRWNYQHSRTLSLAEKTRIKRKAGARAGGGVLRITSDRSRSQHRNRLEARDRLAAIVVEALRPDKIRRSTKPSRSAREKRREDKRRRGETKRMRQRPEY